MMSLPDFKEKQILFIQGSEASENRLQFQNDNILFKKDDENINRISCWKIFAILIIGDFSITTKLIKNCREYGIAIFLLKDNFENYGSFNSGLEGNYLLRMKQYSLKNDLKIAKRFVLNKTYNQAKLLEERKKIKDFQELYDQFVDKIERAGNEKELLGVEGSISKDFFCKYFEGKSWTRRMPRSKYDINNVLLDIGYTFLFNFTDSLLNMYGFDSYKGFYHKLFFQRKSLACDVVEPFRCLIDRQLLKSYNLGQINEKDFIYDKNKYILSYEKQRKYLGIFFNCIMDRKEEIFLYIKDFYYFIMGSKSVFPFFKIK